MNTMTYKGYMGSVEISEKDKCFFGKVLYVRALISYEGETFAEIKKDFEDAVDDYLELCRSKKIKPETPFKGSFNVRISPETHRKLALAARNKGESLNKFVGDVLASSVA